jgi:hypothetical protein
MQPGEGEGTERQAEQGMQLLKKDNIIAVINS